MVKLNVVASGSSGNCYCIENGSKMIFIDCGVPFKRVREALEGKDYSEKDVHLFITHEHTDHIGGIKPFINAMKPRVYASEGTADCLVDKGVDDSLLYVLDADTQYDFDDFAVQPFNIMHDCAEPFGYKIYTEEGVVSFATDLGVAGDYVMRAIEGSQTLVLESNYEERLLAGGSYPEYLKKRIASTRGHLSNKDAVNVVGNLADSVLKKVLFAHVSDDNNDYELLDKYANFCTDKYCVKTEVLRKNKTLIDIKLGE